MDIQELILQPSESLAVEIKGWIDPETNEGIEKIVKAAIALRNNNGGYLIVGFDNEKHEPILDSVLEKIHEKFHVDKIQGLITKYSSEPFEITIHFPEREGREFPVIEIASGVQSPVATKSGLIVRGKRFIKENKVYIRSLNANGTPSTTEAKARDWSRIVDICFENREADIGRFLRRHLGKLSPEILLQYADALSNGVARDDRQKNIVLDLLTDGAGWFREALAASPITHWPASGFWDVALVINGDIPEHTASREFLQLIDSSNPRYTGWPVWLNSTGHRDESSWPYHKDGSWEALIVSLDAGVYNHVDFWRISPAGRFFLRRAFEDDICSGGVVEPLTALDFGLVTLRVAEAVAAGISFALAMGCNKDKASLSFAFKWDGLNGRELCSWADPARRLSEVNKAKQNEVVSEVVLPLDTPHSAIDQYVRQVTRPLFEVFRGFQLSDSVTEDLVRRLIERRL